MNKNPAELMSFRYGGMKTALKCDARMYSFTVAGLTSIWPRKAQVGGFPGKARSSFKPLARGGSQALVKQLKAADDEKAEQPDHQVLAEHCRVVMQAEYDANAKLLA